MKIKEIIHANMVKEVDRDVLLDIDLTESDKEKLYRHHMEHNRESYSMDDVSMIVWILVEYGEETNVRYNGAAYFPAEQGETGLESCMLTDEFKSECVEYVREHYIGKENEFEVH